MTFLEFLDRRATRRAARPAEKRMLASVIGLSLISGFLGALFGLFIVPVPTENRELVIYMLGQLSGFAGGVVAYHYTMSAGAKELDAKRTHNTTVALEGLAAAAKGNGQDEAAKGANAVANAAHDKAEEFTEPKYASFDEERKE